MAKTMKKVQQSGLSPEDALNKYNKIADRAWNKLQDFEKNHNTLDLSSSEEWEYKSLHNKVDNAYDAVNGINYYLDIYKKKK